MKISPVRDSISAAIGLLSGGAGLIGTAAKKLFISENDGFGTRFAVGLLATVISGGTGLIPYLVATPGREDLRNVRQTVIINRYD